MRDLKLFLANCKRETSEVTWLTTMTMAEQRLAMKAVQNIISTLVANTVNIQLAEKGRETRRREFFLPHLSTMEDRRPPRRAPRRERLASQELSWWVTPMLEAARLAKAGEE